MRFRREERFLLIMPEYIWGGAETQFRYLISYADRDKKKLDVMIEHRYQSRDSVLKKDVVGMKNVRFYELNDYSGNEYKYVQSIVMHILRNILKIKYKVCLIYCTPNLILAPILKLLGIKVIYSERNDASTVLSWKGCLRYCNKITANSMNAQKKLEKFTGRRVDLIRNGEPVVQQLPVKTDREIHRVLVPARIVPRKNQMLMLGYLREYPEFDGTIVFAGVVEDRAYQKKLTDFVNRNHLQNRVQFLDYVRNMQEEYKKADLVILPSFVEGTPNVVLEAYAYGRPVIVSDIEAERETVIDPHFRFKPNDPKSVDKCIRYVRNLSDEAYQELLAHNRRFVIENHNIEKMVRLFYKLMFENNWKGGRN